MFDIKTADFLPLYKIMLGGILFESKLIEVKQLFPGHVSQSKDLHTTSVQICQ